MALILRAAKGSKLTIAEMDGNLEYLEELASFKPLPSNANNSELFTLTKGQVIDRITIENTGASSTDVTIGTSSGAEDIFPLTPLAAGAKIIAASNILADSNISVWLGNSASQNLLIKYKISE